MLIVWLKKELFEKITPKIHKNAERKVDHSLNKTIIIFIQQFFCFSLEPNEKKNWFCKSVAYCHLRVDQFELYSDVKKGKSQISFLHHPFFTYKLINSWMESTLYSCIMLCAKVYSYCVEQRWTTLIKNTYAVNVNGRIYVWADLYQRNIHELLMLLALASISQVTMR